MKSKVFFSRKSKILEDKINDFFSAESILVKNINFTFKRAHERNNYLVVLQYESNNKEVSYQAKIVVWNFDVAANPEEFLQRRVDDVLKDRNLEFIETTEFSKGWKLLLITSSLS